MNILVKKMKTLRNKRTLRKLQAVAQVKGDLIVNSATSITNPGGINDNVKIGEHCTFFGTIYALFGGHVIIGNNTYVGTKTYLMAKERITIGNDCIIANDVIVCDNNNHPIEPEKRLEMSRCADYLSDEKWTWIYADSAPIVVEDNIWIGRRAMIMKGVTIGKGSIVGAGAVVTHDVPEFTVVAGNPAKVVKNLKNPR